MSNKYEWNLEDIYIDKNEFDKDFRYIENNMESIGKYKGKLKENSNNIYETYSMLEEFEIIISKLSAYSTLKLHQNMSNSDNIKLYQNVENLINKYSNFVSFITPEITKIDDNKIINFLKENKNLSKYERVLRKIIKDKKHILSKKEEMIISKFSPVLNSFSNIFDMINNVDFKFGTVKNSEEKEILLTNSSYTTLLEDRDRKVRKEAFEKIYSMYGKYINTLTELYLNNVRKEIISSNIRRYSSSLDKAMDEEESKVDVYNNLINVVNKNLYLNHRYMDLKAKLLNLEKLHLYDMYINPLEVTARNIEYEDACKTVKEALSIYGDNYISIISDAMENGWIDVYERENKYSGGYSIGIYGVHPYILINYTNDISSVSTLAHELGHTLHSYLSSNFQSYFDSKYTTMIAEVASTVNEILLAEYLINKEKDKLKKASLINSNIDRIRSTIISQTMFAEFEQIIHSKIEEGISLSSEDISDVFYKLNQKYFGDSVIVDEIMRYGWARVPHFYIPFYTYTYATGISSAICISRRILKGDKKYIEKYLNMLSLGGSKDSLELLKMVDIDLENEIPIKEAFSYFEEKLNELEYLLKDDK